MTVVVVLSVGWFVWSVLVTSQGRVTAVTANRGNLFATGYIELDTDSVTRLLFDASGLYPGPVLEQCITVSYAGTIGDVAVRLHAQMVGGTGLDDFVATRFQVGRGGGEGSCTGFRAERTIFDGTLAELGAAHPDFEGGAVVWEQAQPGDQLTLRATAEIVDDNAAQGLTTEFMLTVEARPGDDR